MRSFQIKINHFCYQTNEQLHRHGQSETPYCYFCTIRFENTNHFFINCPHVRPIWEYVEQIFEKMEYQCNLDDATKILGIFNKDDELTNTANHLIIMAKYFIHLSKFRKHLPTVTLFKKMILDTEYLERQIAQSKQKIDIHFEKWNRLI